MKIIWAVLIIFMSPLYSEDCQNNFKSFIENTIWIVPPSTLLAYQYGTSTYTAVTDQTVWVIDNYDEGYFFGNAYTAIVSPPNPTTYSQKRMLGTVTDSGRVYITFISSEFAEIEDLVNGIGVFSKLQDSYRFIMQMNSGSNTSGMSHWSYMISINKKSPYYYNLPGVNQSLPEFLTNF